MPLGERPIDPADDRYRNTPLVWLAERLVGVYRLTLGLVLGGRCRFQPSCSEYCVLAMRKYGFFPGGVRAAWRICRCQPLCRGGVDFP